MILLNRKLSIIPNILVKKRFTYNIYRKSNIIIHSSQSKNCIIRTLTYSCSNLVVREYPSVLVSIIHSTNLRKLRIILIRKRSNVRLSLLLESPAFLLHFK